jgi:CheY-like chemotaxis protein
MLGLDEPRARGQHQVIVVQHSGRLLGLSGLRVEGEIELMQRPLDPFTEGLNIAIGAATLEDGPPALILNVAEIVRTASASRKAAVPRAPTKPIRVLLVEDSEMTRDVLVDMITGMGFEALEARDGRDGLAIATSERPDLVITDLEMPVMDGFDLIRSIRREPEIADTPIVVLSYRGSDADKTRAAEAGADAYVVKADLASGTLGQTISRFTSGRRKAGL